MPKKRYIVKLREAGFTLLELLVVMVIIGLLVGIVGPKLFTKLGQSEVKTARAQINAIKKALNIYRLDTGHYPSQELGLSVLSVAPPNESKWQGPYLDQELPLDPWKKPYNYRIPGEKNEFDVFSYGKDSQPGGADDNADIYN